MSSAIELRTWLNRPEHTFCTNLAFGIKAWRSIEFVLITKHEIITDEFCRQLPTLRKQLKKASAADTAAAWTLCCEFLSLKSASGAISSAVKEQLVEALRTEARKSMATPHGGLLEALLLTLHNTAMQNFYRSSPATLADLLATICAYLRQLVDGSTDDQWLSRQSEPIAKLLAGVLTFVKQTPQLEQFRQRFASVAYVPLVELIVALRARGHRYTGEFFGIVREMFFPAGSSTALRDFMKGAADDAAPQTGSEFAAMFASPTHALALWLEAILIAFRADTDTQIALHRYLFGGLFDPNSAAGVAADLLPRVTYYLCVLKRHDAQMRVKMDADQVRQFLGQHIEALFARYYSGQLADTLAMLCAAVRLEPMMLQHTMVPMAVKCMVLPKDAATADRFAEYLDLVIEVFRKLSHAPKFVSNLLRDLVECLAVTKLSSKMKRKSAAAAAAVQPASAKKTKRADGDEAHADERSDKSTDCNRFFALLQQDFESQRSEASAAGVCSAADWPDIAFAWPPAVGNAFVQFIGGLVSKPSLVVWKTVLFSLTDYVTLLKEGHSDANTLFLVDICAALFCQYFAGARLAEHTDQTWPQIDPNRQLTHSLLHEFGKAILSQEHNNRTMNAFLRCCLHAADFELLCFYYWPDTLDARAPLRHLHPYLREPATELQWTLVEQRISNFGRDECKANLNRVHLQRMYGAALLAAGAEPSARPASAPPVALDDLHQVQSVLGAAAASTLLDKLSAADLCALCSVLAAGDQPVDVARISGRVLRNKQFVFVLFVSLYNRVCAHFGSGSRAPAPVDCAQLADVIDTDRYADVLAGLVAGVEASAAAGGHLKKADAAAILLACRPLVQLPVDFLGVQRRHVLFALLLQLLVAARKTQHAALVDGVLAQLKRFVHFGDALELFAVLPMDGWVRCVGSGAAVLPLYRSVFERSVRSPTASARAAFDRLLELLQLDDGAGAEAGALLDIALLLVDCLQGHKQCKEQFAQYRRAILAAIERRLAATDRADRPADAQFVARTLSGFVVVLLAELTTPAAAAESAGLRAAFALYLEHASMAGNFAASAQLLSVALQHKAVLGVEAEALDGHVQRYWADYVRALRETPELVAESEWFLKVVLNSKTLEQFVDLVGGDGEGEAGEADVAEWCAYKHRLFVSIGRCQLSKSKGAIFNEIFKRLAVRLLMSLRRSGGPLHQHFDVVHKLLECQKIVCTNIQMPVSVELVDDTLAFLAEINIKAFAASNAASAQTQTSAEAAAFSDRFFRLHQAMSDVCFALVQHRHYSVIDRVAQFGGIVRDLLHAVAFFKVGKTVQTAATASTSTTAATEVAGGSAPLDRAEVQMLANLSHRMENIVKSFVKHAKDVSRIAPYLLLSTINLLVSDDQPTTNNPKVKTHFDYICYDLISILDERVDSFVMRNCNEASKQMYEQLNRDFVKYHKFKGKV